MPRIETIELDGIEYKVGYKVVTQDLKSLGLRKNPNILQYKLNEWYLLSEKDVEESSNDLGGIWVARTLGNASILKKYVEKKHSKKTRIFKTALGRILYSNSYRIKTNGVRMLEEITQ